MWDDPLTKLPAINTDNWGPENWGPQLAGVSASGQTLVARVCERGACMAFDRVDEDAVEALWGSTDAGETWERWGDDPEGGIWDVGETDVAFRDTDGQVKGLRSGEEWVPPEEFPRPSVRSRVNDRLFYEEREPGELDLYLLRDQGALLGAYSWGDQGSDEGHRPLRLIDHLEGSLFVGFLGSEACGDVTKTVLVDFGSGTVHPVPGLDPEADLRRSPTLHTARLAEPPAPTTPTSTAPDATTLQYDTYDTTGAVATAGSYAFLADADGPSWAVTTYQGLRDGTATALLIHTSDADGVSRAGVYDRVEVGDLFEWRQADDCFVRYTVTEVKPDPGGTVQRKLLAVEWMIYAFTGCYGRVTPDTSTQFIWDELSELGGESLKVPVTVGIHQLVPDNWTGAVRAAVHEAAPGGSHFIQQANPSTAVLSALDYWREPRIPEGWSLAHVSAGTPNDPYQGFSAIYSPTEGGGISLEFNGYFLSHRNRQVPSGSTSSGVVVEARVIAGRPALVQYSPAGDNNYAHIPTTISIMDLATESGYTLTAYDSTLKNIDTLTAIVSSLFTEPPTPDATTFRYDTYDTTGAVATAGSYAFLADPDDPSTVVTTYEGLRDGTATALLIHTSDADGVSRAGVYDGVEVGDLFEWRQADDCFVRYRVEDILPTPPSTAARKFLAVEWIAYAGTGCQGSLRAEAVGVRWSPPVIASRATGSRAVTLIASPIRYGPYLLIPVDWEGALEPNAHVGLPPGAQGSTEPSADVLPEWPSWDPAEVRRHPLWRDPVLPEGWALRGAVAYDADSLSATYEDEENLVVVTISLQENRPFYQATPGGPDANIWEARTVDDRPAILWYDPLRNSGIPLNTVKIFDESTGVEVYVSNYTAYTADALETTIAIARSLFESPNAP